MVLIHEFCDNDISSVVDGHAWSLFLLPFSFSFIKNYQKLFTVEMNECNLIEIEMKEIWLVTIPFKFDFIDWNMQMSKIALILSEFFSLSYETVWRGEYAVTWKPCCEKENTGNEGKTRKSTDIFPHKHRKHFSSSEIHIKR